jgi:hypothetical protein
LCNRMHKLYHGALVLSTASIFFYQIFLSKVSYLGAVMIDYVAPVLFMVR